MELKKYEELPQHLREKLNNANVYFQYTFVDFVRQNNEELYFVYDNERIIPIRHRVKAFFNFGVLLSEPFLFADKYLKSEGLFLDETVKCVTSILHTQWINTTAGGLFKDTPFNKCKRIPFGSHILDLSLSREELWKRVHSKHRNVIRKAEKESVVVKKGGADLIKDYVMLEYETQERTGRKASGLFYYQIQINCLKDNIVVYVAYHNNKPQAGGIFYYNKKRCYYMYGATARQAFTGSANLLIWTAINDMKGMGIEEFSFVGCRVNEDKDSKYHGIQMFKERFGGELRLGYMFRYEENHMMYKLFCRAMQWRMGSKHIYQDPIDEEIYKWEDIQE